MSLLDFELSLARADFRLDARARFDLNGITALFGPNGSGKTTLLRCLAGLESRADGHIRFAGTSWFDRPKAQNMPVHQRPVGMVFQQPVLFDHLDVNGNLEFAVKRARPSRHPIPKSEVISAFDLADLLKRRTWELSGGERQRAAMARAVLRQPKLLLMDEPLAALDLVRRAQALGYIEQIPSRFKVPVLYVTHAIDEVVRLADDIILMDRGRIAATGPVGDVLSRIDLPPLTGRFEAGAVLSGRIIGQDAKFRMTLVDIGHGQQLDVPELPLEPGHTVRLRIRARDVVIAKIRPQGVSVRNILSCQIDAIAQEADTAFAEVRLMVGSQPLRARVTRAAIADLQLQPGENVFALIKSVALDRRMLAAKTRADGRPAPTLS